MSEWFHIGQKVVCVEDKWAGLSPLRRGVIYTIAAIGTGYGGIYYPTGEDSEGDTVLDLVEAKNPEDGMFPHLSPGFNAARFRPLRKRTTSIEVFTQLLNSKPELERA